MLTGTLVTAAGSCRSASPIPRSANTAFWGPMAFTIMGGLSAATFLTLFLLPSICALWRRRSLGHESTRPKPERAPNLDAIGAATAAE